MGCVSLIFVLISPILNKSGGRGLLSDVLDSLPQVPNSPIILPAVTATLVITLAPKVHISMLKCVDWRSVSLKLCGQKLGRLEIGIILASSISWASPPHIAINSSKEYRTVQLAKCITVPDEYLVSQTLHVTANLMSSPVLCKIDLASAYRQILIVEAYIQRAAIVTPFNLYEFIRTALGLHSASQTLQRLIDQVTRDLGFVFAKTEDILFISGPTEGNTRHLWQLFGCLAKHDMTINKNRNIKELSAECLDRTTNPNGIALT